MQMLTSASGACRLALAFCVVLSGCGKLKQNDPEDASAQRAETKRQQAACGSSAAPLKGILFDKAISRRDGDRSALDTLADYSFVRMEEPVVTGWDSKLDVTRCKGRMVLEIPAGARQAFGGEQHLRADVDYTAQAAADGSGFVYQLTGASGIVSELAAFNLNSRAFRPSPAIDERQPGDPQDPASVADADRPASPDLPGLAAPARSAGPVPMSPEEAFADRGPRRVASVAPESSGDAVGSGAGEATVRAFYRALGTGNGALASAQIVPEKQQSRAFSPDAISRYYGRLPEPLQLTGIEPALGGSYRVSYRYSTGRARCDGIAVVNVTNRDGRSFIRSIRALSGC